MENRKR